MTTILDGADADARDRDCNHPRTLDCNGTVMTRWKIKSCALQLLRELGVFCGLSLSPLVTKHAQFKSQCEKASGGSRGAQLPRPLPAGKKK